jgi:serine protease Do
MKKLLIVATALGFMSFCNVAFAQDEQDEQPKSDKQNEEIIIRNKGDKDMNLTVQINGDSILVNGKPLDEFIDSQVTIKKRKMIIHDGDRAMEYNNFGKQWEDWGKNFGEQWQQNNEISKPFLGVKTEKSDNGVKILEVIPGSPAEKAGLKEGDIITKVNDNKIDDPQLLSDIVTAQKPKDEITVYYTRNKKESSTKAILAEHKGKRAFAYSFNGPDVHSFEMPEIPEVPEQPEMPEFNFDNQQGHHGDFGMRQHPRLGLKIQDTDDGTVKIIDVEDSSNAAKAGLLKDDVITEIDGQKINNTDEARDQLHQEEGKKSYNIKVLRNGSELNFDVKIPRKLKTADL